MIGFSNLCYTSITNETCPRLPNTTETLSPLPAVTTDVQLPVVTRTLAELFVNGSSAFRESHSSELSGCPNTLAGDPVTISVELTNTCTGISAEISISPERVCWLRIRQK